MPDVVMAGIANWVALVALAAALASAADMAWLSIRLDIPYGADSGRVYFGTDTHSSALLLGSLAGALACRMRITTPRSARVLAFAHRVPVLRGAFWSDLVAIGSLVWLIQIATTVDEFTPWLFRGGFLLIGALCTALVATTPRRLSLIPWALERRPVRWLGTRSYSVYLWHWPVAVVTRADLDIALHGTPLFLLRTSVTFGLAELSYRFVEQPLRAKGWSAVVAALRWHRLPGRTRFRLAPAVGTFVLFAVVSLSTALAYPPPPIPADPIAVRAELAPPTSLSGEPNTILSPRVLEQVPLGSPDPESTPTDVLPPDGASSMPSSASRSASAPAARAARRPSARPRPSPSPAAASTLAISAFGDSVMLGAAGTLEAAFPHLAISAVEGRQARDVFNDIAAHRASHTLGQIVIVHAGDNGIISPSDLEATLSSLADRTLVIVMTDRVPRDWEAPNNDLLRRVVPKFANARLVDWNRLSAHHRDWFYADGLHLPPVGQTAFANAVVAAVTS